jgi:hypothetical protein
MVNNLRREDAEVLLSLVQRNSKALNEFLLDRRESRSKEEFDFIKKVIGRLMGAQYFEVVEVIKDKYKDIAESAYGSSIDLKFEFPEIKK